MEENDEKLLNKRNTHNRWLVITVVIILIIIGIVAFYFKFQITEGISGMEAISLSDPYALEWNENAVLVGITANDFGAEPTALDENGGLFDRWFCTYAVQTNIGDNTSAIQFSVFSNGTVIEQFQVNSSVGYVYEGMISNWTIDSDEAYNIAGLDYTVKLWKEDYPDAELNMFGSTLDKSAWSISWSDKSDGNDEFLNVYVDAITGEIFINS